MDKQITIFDGVERKEVDQAIKNLIAGKTPITEVRKLPAEAGGYNYVNTYYMTRQISLITGFRWSSECLEEKYWPSEQSPVELGAKMRVTIWDKQGNTYSHISWGSAKPQKNKKTGQMPVFDTWKAAYSDGIKKCLSYFGIANDVYGGRDLDYFGQEPDGEQVQTTTNDQKIFFRYLSDKKILPSEAMQKLGIDSWSEVEDWQQAYNTVKEVR